MGGFNPGGALQAAVAHTIETQLAIVTGGHKAVVGGEIDRVGTTLVIPVGADLRPGVGTVEANATPPPMLAAR